MSLWPAALALLGLAGALDGRPLDLPRWSLLELAEGLPSVAGGPADPAAAAQSQW